MSDDDDMTADEFEGRLARADSVTEGWCEVWVTGQPAGEFPPYDFTFCSDRDTWRHWRSVVETARESWTEVRVRRREVRRTAWATPWREV
jgi:hypothetical protein